MALASRGGRRRPRNRFPFQAASDLASSLSSLSGSDEDSEAEKDINPSQESEPYLFTDEARQNACLQGFHSLYESKQLFDITLCVDGKKFECHKTLLAASSEYFRAMFTISLSEKDKNEVTINGVDHTSMALVIQYMYTGKVQLETDIVQNLLSAANLFRLMDLRDGCAAFMAKRLDSDNCIGIYFFAQAHDCDNLKRDARDMITEMFDDVSETIEFLELMPENLEEILRFEEIQTVEEDIFESVMTWLDHKPEERSPHIYEIFSLIRFELIDEYFLYDRVRNNVYLQSDTRIQRILDEVIRYKLLKNRWHESDLMQEPRYGHGYTRVIVYTAYMDDDKRQVLQVYGQRSDDVCRSGNLGMCDLQSENPALLVTGDGDLYLAGGDEEGLPTFLKWLPDESSFDECACMPIPRKQFCLVQVDKLIYAVGGCNQDGILSQVDCYNEEEDEWKPVAPLPKPLRCFCAVAFSGKLYVFGGETEKVSKKVTRGRTELNKNVLCYDPHEDRWTMLAEMSQQRALTNCAVFRSKIYVIGGFGAITDSWIKEKSPEQSLHSVEIYDAETNSWEVGPDLPLPLCGLGVVKYRSTIYVVGGESEHHASDSVYALSSDGATWQRQDDLLAGCTETTIYSSYSVMNVNVD